VDECDRSLDELASSQKWVIDGFGTQEVITRRLSAADGVVFVDFPLTVHYWWACKRQWRSRRHQRSELPDDCPEFTLTYSWKLAREMWEVHRDYRPWFLDLIQRLPARVRIFHLRSPKEWKDFASQYGMRSGDEELQRAR